MFRLGVEQEPFYNAVLCNEKETECLKKDKKENPAPPSDDGSDFKNEVIIKSGVISIKDEVTPIATPKILGKIDLSNSGRKKHSAVTPTAEKKAEPAPQIRVEKVEPIKKEEKKPRQRFSG